MIIKKAIIDKANRLYQLPLDIVSFTREKTRPTRIKKIDVLDLARFNWPVTLTAGLTLSEKQLFPADKSRISLLKEAVAEWISNEHGAKVNPGKEVFIGGGISSIMMTLALAFVDNGDIVFVPELGLPLYRKVTMACGGEPVHYTVSHKNNWQPDFERLSTRLGRVARLLFLNSPHNPTGASLDAKAMENLIWMASRENVVVVNDAAYQAISTHKPASLLAIEGGRKVGIEVYSFAYTFGLPAIPFGFAVGNRDVINGLESAGSLLPAFIPDFYIDLALTAIRQYPGDNLKNARDIIERSEAEAVKLADMLSLEKAGFDSTPFLWAKIAGRKHARTQASILYRRSRILVAPGTAFGENGDGFIRLSLTTPPEDYQTARERIKRKLNLLKVSEDD
ncbi:MAG: aminotransferase class I/II-fold pyridoxal phosphate-dependent enzyme [Candidatus Zixiibacteriota bacterium]